METLTKNRKVAIHTGLSPQTTVVAAATSQWTRLGVNIVDGGIQTHPSQSQVAQHVVILLLTTTEAAAQRAPPGYQHANACGHYHPTLSPNQR